MIRRMEMNVTVEVPGHLNALMGSLSEADRAELVRMAMKDWMEDFGTKAAAFATPMTADSLARISQRSFRIKITVMPHREGFTLRIDELKELGLHEEIELSVRYNLPFVGRELYAKCDRVVDAYLKMFGREGFPLADLMRQDADAARLLPAMFRGASLRMLRLLQLPEVREELLLQLPEGMVKLMSTLGSIGTQAHEQIGEEPLPAPSLEEYPSAGHAARYVISVALPFILDVYGVIRRYVPEEPEERPQRELEVTPATEKDGRTPTVIDMEFTCKEYKERFDGLQGAEVDDFTRMVGYMVAYIQHVNEEGAEPLTFPIRSSWKLGQRHFFTESSWEVDEAPERVVIHFSRLEEITAEDVADLMATVEGGINIDRNGVVTMKPPKP